MSECQEDKVGGNRAGVWEGGKNITCIAVVREFSCACDSHSGIAAFCAAARLGVDRFYLLSIP
jgi:hypothetical protein